MQLVLSFLLCSIILFLHRDSDQTLLENSAHWYSECSNAGICNRRTGECECFDGFEGYACQHLQCPGIRRKNLIRKYLHAFHHQKPLEQDQNMSAMVMEFVKR